MLFREKISGFGHSFSYLQCAIFILYSHTWAFSSVSPVKGQEEDLVHVEIILIDLPTFQTGETGPLSGRVVMKIQGDSPEPLNARAFIKFEGQKESAAPASRAIYPGVSSTLDFPLELSEPREEDDYLAGQLNIEVEGGWSLSRPVFFYVRSHGMFFRTYRSRIDDTIYPYALYLPKKIKSASGSWPMVLSLHGAWSNYANNLKRLLGIGNRPGEPDELAFVSLPVWPELPEVDGIIVCPWGRGTLGYHGPGEQDVLDVVELVMKEYPVDPERVSVTGLSMGGNGTWEMALHHADMFTAAVPVCGAGHFNFISAYNFTDEDRKKHPFLDQLHEQNSITNYGLNGLPLKIRVHHGTDDPTVPFEHSEKMLEVLAQAGIEAPFFTYDNVGHNAWDPAYKDAETLKWLLSQHRERPSREITLVAGRYHDARYQWLEVTRFTKYGKRATVRARYDDSASTISLETENVSRLELDLAQLPGLSPGKSVKLISPTGKRLLSLNVPEQGRASLEIKRGRVKQAGGKAENKNPLKRKNLEGPIYEAFSDRVVLVYGTKGSGAQETYEQLKKFADWGELPDVHFIIKPDTGVSEEDIQNSHLVLFGDPENNALLARINDKSPVRFRKGEIIADKDRFPASETAFKCVFPNPLNPDRLVLWNYAEEWDYTSFLFYLDCFEWLPDYFIYRRGANLPSAAEILKAGFFDSNWQWD
jgi:pimeloyl-ACP methyl ester carboxylesterase